AESRVLHIASRVKPYRMPRPVAGAVGVLELKAGRLQRCGTEPGDQIRFSESIRAIAKSSCLCSPP
ncbi:MAG: DUF192 domain-containing protein, partial [Propionibacteriaceae bacterium]|nr:DUF192 domain-containing protein [Propionibacteriaceae bacterium]